ncbi:MAG: terminase TerL endonuclease subunit [Candidatus Paceibacterota bacterium]
MYDELIIPPTVSAGVRWVASYAGWLGESLLLREIWERALTGSRTDADLPVYSLPDASLMAFIDAGEASWRMPWTTAAYMREVQASERPNTYRRLWLNEWVSQESEFITPDQWQACYSADVKPLLPGDRRRAVFGADASTSRDLTALVGVVYDQEGGFTDAVYTRVWKPKPNILRLGKPTVDLDDTLKAEILKLHKAGQVEAVVYDPYQLHSIALDLGKAGVRMIELPQTNQRTEADQALYDAINGRLIRHYGDPTLTEHISNAVAIETPRGFRLAKEKTSRKIDAAVALSMAHHGALSTQKRYGGVEVMADPFASWPPNPGEHYTGVFGWSDKVNERPHPPGVTWVNCKHRNKGCLACVAELDESGFFREAEAMRNSLAPQSEDERREMDRFMNQLGAGRARVSETDRKRNDLLRDFWRQAKGE